MSNPTGLQLVWNGKDKIINHHNEIPFRILNEIFIYKGKELIYKIWLKMDKLKEYRDVKETMKDVGMRLIKWTN